jgi:DNA-binding MarR family transcriptional regulator
MTFQQGGAPDAPQSRRTGDLCANEMNVEMKMRFTEKQGQYLAFIYNYSKIHGRAPAEADLELYFKVTPPTIHQMILKLEEKGLISRVPGQPRSIRLQIPPEKLPMLK